MRRECATLPMSVRLARGYFTGYWRIAVQAPLITYLSQATRSFARATWLTGGLIGECYEAKGFPGLYCHA